MKFAHYLRLVNWQYVAFQLLSSPRGENERCSSPFSCGVVLIRMGQVWNAALNRDWLIVMDTVKSSIKSLDPIRPFYSNEIEVPQLLVETDVSV
ncbi:unnamed protein product [Nezara viridula]|uniref:Uncharacterized protein n=1 Tax=Nezara viridula TaxID=85310 RepID=A0A9P0MQZ5_NEZVI|nr:unnamed protein product [Nezara viridula]